MKVPGVINKDSHHFGEQVHILAAETITEALTKIAVSCRIECWFHSFAFVTKVTITDGDTVIIGSPIVNQVGVHKVGGSLGGTVLVDDRSVVQVRISQEGVGDFQRCALIIACG